ncbi:MAG: hypothetical protein Q4C59_14840 [Lachnospiraceae bacterium]|nr:hypothetical protein [Lachnospiraceae bacterium]
MMNALRNLGLVITNAYRERYEREFSAKYERIYNKTKKIAASR